MEVKVYKIMEQLEISKNPGKNYFTFVFKNYALVRKYPVSKVYVIHNIYKPARFCCVLGQGCISIVTIVNEIWNDSQDFSTCTTDTRVQYFSAKNLRISI